MNSYIVTALLCLAYVAWELTKVYAISLTKGKAKNLFDEKLEAYKSELQIKSIDHQIYRAKYYDKQFIMLSELNSKLYQLIDLITEKQKKQIELFLHKNRQYQYMIEQVDLYKPEFSTPSSKSPYFPG